MYWESGNQAEVDFILYNSDGLIPVEVKADNNVGSQSLKVYMNRYKLKYAIRISTKNFGFANNIKSVPLYATFLVKQEINKIDKKSKKNAIRIKLVAFFAPNKQQKQYQS